MYINLYVYAEYMYVYHMYAAAIETRGRDRMSWN